MKYHWTDRQVGVGQFQGETVQRCAHGTLLCYPRLGFLSEPSFFLFSSSFPCVPCSLIVCCLSIHVHLCSLLCLLLFAMADCPSVVSLFLSCFGVFFVSGVLICLTSGCGCLVLLQHPYPFPHLFFLCSSPICSLMPSSLSPSVCDG